MPQETVVSQRKNQTPWLMPVLAGLAGLCVLGSIGKMVRDLRDCHENLQRPRERWEVDE